MLPLLVEVVSTRQCSLKTGHLGPLDVVCCAGQTSSTALENVHATDARNSPSHPESKELHEYLD